LVNSEDICRKPQRAAVDLIAQNGRIAKSRPLTSDGCAKAKKKRKHSKRHRGH
jgi:hypothetical protein